MSSTCTIGERKTVKTWGVAVASKKRYVLIMGGSPIIGILILAGLCFAIYSLLPKKPFTYDGRTTSQKDVNEMRNFGGGILLIVFVVLVLALIV
jgi:hypothetical protein